MNKEKTVSILFSGLGGQGVLKASEICGQAAMLEGYHVKKSEVHGMAQRGGLVESHLRFGKCVYSPLIPAGEADYLLSFHHDNSFVNRFLKPGGIDFTPYLKKVKPLLQDRHQYLNVFFLGILSCYLPLKKERWLQAAEMNFSSRSLHINKEIFLKGRQLGGCP